MRRYGAAARQKGTVLVFKPGLTDEQIRDALGRLDDVLDNSEWIGGEPRIEEFDPRTGGPVWYIP